jgi:hypothetical protein
VSAEIAAKVCDLEICSFMALITAP